MEEKTPLLIWVILTCFLILAGCYAGYQFGFKKGILYAKDWYDKNMKAVCENYTTSIIPNITLEINNIK